MTGSIHKLARQHSSTESETKATSPNPSMFRRSFSVDDKKVVELVSPNDYHHKHDLSVKRTSTTTEEDSGTEEIEQQLEITHIAKDSENDDCCSVKSSGQNPDEGFSECENQDHSLIERVKTDLMLARSIKDDAKKDFCDDARTGFHGEFARLISIPLSLRHNKRVYLFAQEELLNTIHGNVHIILSKMDNAKAQFKCSNEQCNHSWTSMRARILFQIATNGFIILKIFGQNCFYCGEYSMALWYMDEVCRVMKSLAKTIFEQFYPDMLDNVDLNTVTEPENYVRKASNLQWHDPNQRRGTMLAPHKKELCEACRLGVCFTSI